MIFKESAVYYLNEVFLKNFYSQKGRVMKNFLNWHEKSYSQKFLILFLAFSALMWTLIPTSYYQSLHLDPAETLMWGSTFNFGNAKHPPMSGYMLYLFCSIFNFFCIFFLIYYIKWQRKWIIAIKNVLSIWFKCVRFLSVFISFCN